MTKASPSEASSASERSPVTGRRPARGHLFARIRRAAARIIEHWVPEDLPGPEARAARVLSGYVWMVLITSPSWILQHVVEGRWGYAGLAAMMIAPLASPLFVLRRTASIRLASHVNAAISIAVVVPYIIATGGTQSPLMVFLIIPPLFAVSLTDVRSGALWSVVASLLIWLTAGFEIAGTPLPAPMRDQVANPASLAGNFTLLSLYAVACNWFSEREKDRAIDELAATNAQLDFARRAAEAAAQTKQSFLANMSHEIRTPMNGVMGMAQLLQANDLDDDSRELADIMVDSANNLLRILDDVLDLSKMQAGALHVARETTDIVEELERVTGLFSVEARRKQLYLQMDIVGSLPRHLETDPVRLRQILANLIGNALKFTNSGGITVRPLIRRAGGEHDRLLIDVVDTGPGIDDERREQIFDAFAQADPSSTRRYGGTGLGLTISRQLANLLGGSLELVSPPGPGCTFRLALPLREAAAPSIAAPERDDIAHDAGRSRHVLLVEDNELNQRVTLRMLQQLGHVTTLATHGLAAVERLREDRHFDSILMDCEMPEMDGLTATSLIRELERDEGRPRTPIIALTAHAMHEQRARCIEVGMDAVLTKPTSLDALSRALARHHRRPRAPTDPPVHDAESEAFVEATGS